MRAFVGKPKLSGAWDEEIHNCINIFNTLSDICEETLEDKLKSVPVMLSGVALNYSANNVKGNGAYEEDISTLRAWYNSDFIKALILSKWHSMSLIEEMSEYPEKSDLKFFRKSVSNLMSLQYQLDITYRTDQFLRDRLLTSVNIPAIQSTLQDRLSGTSQQDINRDRKPTQRQKEFSKYKQCMNRPLLRR